MIRLVLVLLILAFGFGAADAQTFGLHTISAHERGGMNNVNPGVYARFDNGFTAGTFRNSMRKQSVYVGWTVETNGNPTLALTVGGITGYQAGRVTFMAIPSAAYHFGGNAVRVGIVPRPRINGGSGALHLMVERHF